MRPAGVALAIFVCLCAIAALPLARAEATDAAKSESTGSGLQFATAGVLAQFTVTAKDESGVRRTSGGDEWIVELDGTRSLTGSVVDNLDGTYQVSYTATKSGSYEAGVKLAKSGGLTGSYFENVWFFYTPVKVTVDPQINMDWGTGLITPTGANYISVRWVGKVKTQYAETYTFYATTDDGARLWVDSVPLIDRWDSYCNETSATIALKANVFYDIKMEYKQVTGSAFAKLSWASQSTPKEIVPSSQLYYETQAKKSPFSFIVMPNVANGTRSTAAGTGLAVATAGTGAQFTIQANDMYDNERGEGGDVFSVRVYPPGSIEVGAQGRAVHGVVVDNTDSSYSVEYTTYKSGNSTLYAALLVRGGITATYYDNQDFTIPVKYAEGTTNLQKVQFSSVTASNNDNSVPTVAEFSVRYAGFVAPAMDSTYQFKWDRGAAASGNDRVKVWVDNSLIVDQWSSLGAADPTGTIELRSAYYYDTKVEYRISGCTTGACAASQKLQWAPSGQTLSDVGSTNLYRGYNLMGSPYTVDVKPAGTCAAKSIAVANQAGAGHSLELSTAGLQAEFTITAKDLYGNLRGTGGDNFKVRLTGVDSASGLVQDLSPAQPGSYRVVYTATKSGTYDISVVFGASGINQSPFRMVTQPARRHLAKSVPTGVGLSLATAGVLSSVTITVKDRHDNWQPDPSVVEAGIQFSLSDSVTLQPTAVVQDAVTPADIPGFVDTVSYIGPSTNAGHQVATPTNLDNPRLVLRYTATRSGSYNMVVGGTKANDGSVFGSPFALTMFPNVACATTSTATGDSLSLATAGIPGVFTIQARDQYYNLRGSNSGDNFVARVRQFYSVPSGATAAEGVVECGRPGVTCQSWQTYNYGSTTVGGRDKAATITDRGDGTYVVSYNATRSTTNYVWASFAVAGGLQATYYTYTAGDITNEFGCDVTAATPNCVRTVQTDQSVDFSVTASLTTRMPGAATNWAARWTGLVRPSLSETYTFHAGGSVSGTAKAERVKLWVDNSLIISQWSSLALPSAAATGHIDLVQDQYYEVLLEAKTVTANPTATAPFQLKWSSNHHVSSVISSSRLFQSHHISNSPFVLNVLPATTCAGTSRVRRPALTLTTAGILSSFTVQSKDAFDNIRTLAIEESSAFDFAVLANASLPGDNTDANRLQPSEDNGGLVAYQAGTVYIGDGGYQVNYTATRRGVYNVRGQIMQPGGVFGTYFENDDLTDHGTDTLGVATEAKPFQRMDATIDFDWSGSRPVPAPSLTMKKDIGPSYFSARWQGMVRPSFSEVFTFHAMVDDGAKLWINGLLIIDQWYSRCSEVDGTIALMADTLYAIKLEYKQVVGNSTVQLRWASRSQPKTIVPSSSLYSNTTTYNLCNRNQSLYVEPAVVCASASTAEGAGLTGATAGRPAMFTIQSRDEYMNNRKLSDAGVRPGYAGYYCDDWSHSGAVNPLNTQTSVSVYLDASTASAVDDYYLGRTITITSGAGAGQSRIISNYVGSTKLATVTPPLTVVAESTSTYSITNYGGQFSERCDSTRTQSFREGHPEFHVRVTPVIEGSQAPYHASGIIDQSLIKRNQQGSGIARLSSTEYPGGLTATYYDSAGEDPGSSSYYNPGFSSPVFATWCTTAQPCEETVDFSSVATAGAWKRTYGEFPEALANVGVEAGSAPVHPLSPTYYDHESAGWVHEEILSDKEYGVRWSGFISPTLAGVYTFHAHFHDSTGNDDRVKLWIDNQLVIQQWNSLAVSQKAIGTFHFAMAYPSAYTISVHYKNPGTATAGGLTLRWDNIATGSTLSGIIHSDSTAAAYCYTAGTSDLALSNICLATISTASPFTQVLNSPYGTVSDVDDAYVGQVIQYTSSSLSGSGGTELHYVHDYFGVKTGTCRSDASANTEAFLDEDASTTDTFYVGHYLHITSGTGAGDYHLITAYTGCSQSGCDPYTDDLAHTTWQFCYCAAATSRRATFTAGGTATDTTSKYRIAMYRAALNVPRVNYAAVTTPKLTSGAKNAYASFAMSTGYTLVTYGSAECAEYTGTAAGGGPITTAAANFLVGSGTATVDVTDAALLFGQLVPAGYNLFIATTVNRNILVTVVATNTITYTQDTVGTTATCTASLPCSITPRSTIVLDSAANTGTNFYSSGTYYLQIVSGSCVGQWRKVVASTYWSAQNYVTAAVAVPWTETNNADILGCAQPDSTSVYYLSKVCAEATITLQTVGPLSSLTVRPGADGNAILQSAQSNTGSGTGWNPNAYGQTPTEGDQYPYPYQPYDQSCCKALSGAAFDKYYVNMLIVITSGTGRGQRRFTTAYAGDNLLLSVAPRWTVLPDSTSRYAIYRAQQTNPVDTSAGTPLTETVKALSAAPVVPSTRLFPLRSRYEVTYLPTVKGDYQVHATLAQGSGLDATYYDDMELSVPVATRSEDGINFDVKDAQRGFGTDVPRDLGALALSDRQSFSVRWAGLLQIFDDENHQADTQTPHVFTFEAGIAETDERVKLWVDNSLIIDRWETYDYLSGTTFSATIGLTNPHYYDIKMEYKQYAGAAAQAVLRWQCSINGAACQSKSVIPSGNLFKAREISGSPFPPHEVHAAPTCADRSTVRGTPLSLATAGVMDTFTIQAHDEYDNERGMGGDTFVVRAVPYNTWDKMEPYNTARGSKDCISCPSTVRGTVVDMGDSSYEASINGTKKGAYKVLTSIAVRGGLSATYYAATTVQYGASRFHRSGQVADSESDWPTACVYRNDFTQAAATQSGYTLFNKATDVTDYTIPNGAWRGSSSGEWRGKHQCQNWISGRARKGSCSLSTGYGDAFASCKQIVSTQTVSAFVSGTSVTFPANQPSATDYPAHSLVGTVVAMVGSAAGAGEFATVTAYATALTATVAMTGVNAGTSTYSVYDCGSHPTAITQDQCTAASTALAPTTWHAGTSNIVYLDFAMSDMDKSYEQFNIKITSGTCKGQVRQITKYYGRQRLAIVGLAWSTADGTMTSDAYGAIASYSGCATGPDETSTYMLYRDQFAPGSMDYSDARFGVRWAGFVQPSSTAEYTFQSLLAGQRWTGATLGAGTQAGVDSYERIKLWVDNKVVIDQWASLASTTPSGTIAFASASGELYDIQVDYVRAASSAYGPSGTAILGGTPAAATPATQLPPRMTLRWRNQQSGSDAVLSEAYDFHVISSARLFSSSVVPNSRVLDLQVAGTSPGVSVAAGSGLTAATAGSEAYFTITAKDAFANDRELEEDSFVVSVEGPNSFRVNAFPVPSPSMPGTYHVAYVATQSGNYDISVRRATAGGLMGEYFNNMWLLGEPAVAVVDPEVSYNWAAAAVAPTGSTGVATGADYMSVRWSGMFKPELSEDYTFFASVDSGVRLYVDGALVVDQWDATAASEYSSTLAAEAGLMYELKLEYRHVTGDASASLSYSSPSVAKRVIPSSRLFSAPQHVFGSPFKSFVSPSSTCSATSLANGVGLSTSTAGHAATFVLQARDEYMNARTKWEDTFVVKASQTDHLGRAKPGVVSANVVKGKYNVAYLVTRAGAMNIFSSLAVSGGIMATYYDSVSATFYSEASGNTYGGYSLPAKSEVAKNIYANNVWITEGGGSCACSEAGAASGTAATGGTCACRRTSLVQDNIFAARWSGLVRPSTAATYTFHTVQTAGGGGDAGQQRVKLWLDNKLVIDQWSSLAAASPTVTYAFPVANDYYEVDMEYVSLTAGRTLTDYMANANYLPTAYLAITQATVGVSALPLGSASIAQSAPVAGSPYPVNVAADVTDFASSSVVGDALTVATAGVQSEFTITSSDTHGNLRSAGGDQYLVHVSSVAGSVFEGTVTDVADGTYTVQYTPSVQGTYDVKVYLGSADKTTTLLVEPGAACASTSVPNGSPLTTATAGYSATFTIQAKDAFKNLRTLGTDQYLVKITSGTEVHNNPVSYIGSAPNTNLGRFVVAYRATKSGAFSVDVRMAHSAGLVGSYYRDEAFTNLAVTKTDSTVNVDWVKGSPSVEVGIVDGFSVAWSGYVKPPVTGTYTFYPTMKEPDERVKLWVDDQWIVDQWASLSSSVATVYGTLWLAANALYDVKLQYKDVSGASAISLSWEGPNPVTKAVIPSTALFSVADPIAGSPFAASVYPARTSGTVSTAFGSGLSVATAGVEAAFTIQARDHLGNPKTAADDTFVVRARHNADFTKRNIVGTVRSLSGNRGQYSVTYTPTWKRNKYSCATPTTTSAGSCVPGATDPLTYHEVGLTDSAYTIADAVSVRKQVVATPSNLVGAKHKFHDLLVSQAVRGGLMATYYTAAVAEASRTAAAPQLYSGTHRTKIVPTVNHAFATSPTAACLDTIDTSFGSRYAGFFSPPTAEEFTFYANTGAGNNERVRVWMDNSLIIDQWTSLSATDASGKLQFGVTGLYDVKIEYKQEASSSNDAGQLDFKYQYSGELTPVVIPSTRLYQSYDLTFKIFDQAGLTATYYNAFDTTTNDLGAATAVVTQARKAVQESTVDWSGAAATDRPYPGSVATGGFSVRWTGFVKPSRTDEYTFYTPVQGASGSSEERVQLWIDNTLVVSQWASLSFLEPSGTISFPVAGDYYNIVMDYKVPTSQVARGVALKWENLGQSSVLFGKAAPATADQVAKGIVRADRLFQIRTTSVVERDDMITWDTSYFSAGVPTLENREAGVNQVWARINGCPDYVDCTTSPTTCRNQRHDRCRGQGTRVNDIVRVDVKPGPVCASTTTVSDDGGLSLSTAGITRTFMLTARDEFDNQRDAVDDSFIARASLVAATAADRPFHSTFTHQPWDSLLAAEKVNFWDQNGKYSGSYIITRSGAYSAKIQTTNVDKTGPNKGLFGTYFSTTNLAGTAVTQEDTNINFNWGRGNPTTSADIVANQFSVRWTGYVRTNYTEVYTFFTNCDYGVRLYVDDLTLINNWATAGREYSATFSAKGTVLYDLTLEYQTTAGLSFCELWFSSPSTAKQVVSQDDLFIKAQTISSGDKSIDVVASVVSGTVSSIQGAGLSIATAGIPASFTIVSKDMYGNTRDQCNDIMFARMVPDAAACGSVGPGSYDYDWSISTPASGTTFSCSKQGKVALLTTDTSTMMTEIAGGTDDNHGVIGSSLVAQTMSKPVPLDTAGTSCTRLSNTGNKHPFAYIQTRAGSHTLYASEVPGGRATSYFAATGTGLMATYYETSSFGTPRNARDCRLVVTGSPQSYATSYCDTSTATIATSNLITPASLIDDGIFSVRWAGLVRMPATFTTLTFNALLGSASVVDERVKLWVDNSLLIDQWTSLAATTISSVINTFYLPTASSLYDIKVEYKNVVGGVSDGANLNIRWESSAAAMATIPSASLFPHHDIGGQPLRVRVNPNVAFHRECEVYGNGLTLATAGVQATFAIQSKDAYNNKRGTGGDLFVVRAFSDGCQVYDNSVSEPKQHTCQPYGLSIPTCGQATDTVCPASTNPPPETNDGGDDDGDWSASAAGATGVSRKAGNSLATDYAASLCPTCPRIVRADVTDNGDGTYKASFTGTQKGRYTVVSSLVNPGGLAATFYGTAATFTGNQGSDWTSTGFSYKVDETVDWSASAVSTYPVTELVDGSGANFKVRWVGFVRPSRASQYTFHAHIAETAGNTDRVKLWVDNSIVIEQWMSLGSVKPSGTLGFAKANGYYDISMIYKCNDNSAAACGYTLQWENTASGVANDDVSLGTIPSTRLFQRYDVPNTGLTASGSPLFQTKDYTTNTLHTTLRVRPAVTCATQSTAYKVGLTLATAGTATSFTIQAKDAYENAREDSNAAFTVDLFGSGGSPIYNGQVATATANSGTYVASYTAENAKNFDLFVKFGGENIKGSPFSNTVKPAAQCGTKSSIQGTGLTAASISPSKSAFTIQARDQYGNAKTQALTSAEFVVRVARTSGSGMQGTNGPPPFYGKTAISTSPTVHATFNTATNDGKYAGYYQIPSTPSPTGYTHYLYASYVTAGGVYATYYDSSATQTVGVPINTNNLNVGTTAMTKSVTTAGLTAATWTTSNGDGPWGSGTTLKTSDDVYVVRYSGMYKPNSQTQMYFRWTSLDANRDRVKLWIDNKLIIEQWISLANTSPSGTYLFDSSNGIYDFHTEIFRKAGGTTTPQFEDSTTTTFGTAIPTARLYLSDKVSGSPYAVTVST